MSDAVLTGFLAVAGAVGVCTLIGGLVGIPLTRLRNQRACNRGDHDWGYGRIEGLAEPEVGCRRCYTPAPVGVRPRDHLAQ